MSGKPRPRERCPVCGKNVALYANGQRWVHYVPGFGLWSDPNPWCRGSGRPYGTPLRGSVYMRDEAGDWVPVGDGEVVLR